VQSKQEKIDSMKDAAVEREMEAMRGKQEMTSLQRQKEDVDNDLAAAKTSLKELREELDQARGLAQGLQKEKELYKTHFNSTEETLRSAHDEHQALKQLILVKESEIKALREQIDEKNDSIQTFKDAVDKEKQQSDKLIKKISATQECVLHLQDKLANAKDRATAAEECKLMLDEQMKAYIAAYEGSAKDLVDARGQIHDLKDQVKRKDKLLSENAEANARLQTSLNEKQMEKEAADAKINALEAVRQTLLQEKATAEFELEEKRKKDEVHSAPEVDAATGEVAATSPHVDDESSSDAALHALKTVISHLEKRLEKRDKQVRKLTKTIVDSERAASDNVRLETELKKQVEDLKRRLAMGAEEYKKKYIECKKLQRKMEKIKKEHCVSESDMEVSQMSMPSDSLEKEFKSDEMKQKLEKIKEKKNKFKKLYESECEKNANLRLEIESLRHQLETQKQAGNGDDVIMKQPSATSALASAPVPIEKPRESNDSSGAPSSPCLKPLPPPMIPVVLPSAKISAVRSFYDLPPSPKELEETLLASAAENGRTVKALNESRGTADGETGIPEDVNCYDNNADEKEEFFLAPEPSQHSPSPPPPRGPSVASLDIASSNSHTIPKMVPLPSIGASRAVPIPGKAALVTQPPPLPPKRTSSTPQEHEDTPTVCEECSFTFPRGCSDEFIASHIQEHAGRLCPVCSKTFPSKGDKEQKAFEEHVQSHFEDPDEEEEEESLGNREAAFEFV